MVVVDIRHHHHHHRRHRRSGRIIIMDTNIIYGHNNHRPSFAHRVLSFTLQATHAGLTREITHVLYMYVTRKYYPGHLGAVDKLIL